MNPADEELCQYFEKSFTNITPKSDQIERIEWLRRVFKDTMADILENVPAGRCRSIALTHLETALMYSVKEIVLEA